MRDSGERRLRLAEQRVKLLRGQQNSHRRKSMGRAFRRGIEGIAIRPRSRDEILESVNGKTNLGRFFGPWKRI